MSSNMKPLGDFNDDGNLVCQHIPPRKMMQADWEVNGCSIYTICAVLYENIHQGAIVFQMLVLA
jgi:hypothetical protein